jgi:hypothetical protein
MVQLGLGGALGPAPGVTDSPFAEAPIRAAQGAAPAGGAGAGDQRLPPRVTEAMPDVVLIAVRPAWVRVRAADGTILLERTMQAGDSWVVPASDAAPTLRTGAAGAVYFALNGTTYGPAGANGEVVDNIALAPDPLSATFAQVDPEANSSAREAIAVAEAVLGRLQLPE